jgi:hypothetical protein
VETGFSKITKLTKTCILAPPWAIVHFAGPVNLYVGLVYHGLDYLSVSH